MYKREKAESFQKTHDFFATGINHNGLYSEKNIF